MSKGKNILIAIVVGLVAVVLMKDLVVKSVITTVGSTVVGAPIKVGKFSMNLFSEKIRINDFKLMNPKGFGSDPLIDITEVGVDYKLSAILKGNIDLSLVILNVNEMSIVKNKEGMLNVDALKVAKSDDDKKGEDKKAAKEKSKDMSFKIDELRLNIGKVIYKDNSKGSEDIKVYEDVMKDKVFKNINSPEQLATLILVNGMGPTAIKGAKIYAAATLLSVGFLPAGVVGALVAKDDSSETFEVSIDKALIISTGVLERMGELRTKDVSKGKLKGKVNGTDITIEIKTISSNNVEVKVTARKMMIPKPEIASGVLHEISKAL